ncbi:MAG: transglutaminase domain-containing protein [Candidatus Zixiibacteriota bacterium]|nr:MAG: transglutaminase domain-containing protein [candidate division Zixibacteria bacterium]
MTRIAGYIKREGEMNYRYVLIYAIFLIFACKGLDTESDPNRFDSFLGTEWYGVYMQGGKVGYAEMYFEKIDAPLAGWRTRESIIMILSIMGQTDTMKITDTRFYTLPGGELYSNESKFSSVTGGMSVTGVKEADEYIVTINLGGQETKQTFEYPVDYLDNLKKPNLMIAGGEISVEDSINITYFEPTPPLTGPVHTGMRIESIDKYIFNGVPTDVYTVSYTIAEMQFSGTSIYDMTGRELEMNLGGGMILKLEGREQAIKIDEEFDLLDVNLVRPETKIEDPQQLRALTLKITGIGEADILNTDLQRITVVTEDILNAEIRKGNIPKTVLNLPIESEEMKPYLASSVYIQSDAEEIKSLAADIIGDEKNSWEAAKKINQWVFDNIEKQFTPDFSNALQTLQTKQGDCGEHSALTVALLRAVGIPARPVAGLVYWPPGEGFGYHAWVEVFVGEWVMMDPSWGEDIVNPAHIALTTGDLVDQTSILSRVMGKMGIEVVEAE